MWRFTLLSVLALLITALGIAAQHPTRHKSPGVAFELIPDYGIAAIYLKDGTSVPIARVQGTPAFQAFMKNSTASTTPTKTPICRILAPLLSRLPSDHGATGVDDVCSEPDVTGTRALLGTLKLAVESYLGTNICFTGVSIDDIQNKRQVDVSQGSLQALHIRQVEPIFRGTYQSMVAHRPDASPEFDQEPWYILAVDYSLHWFNVGLYSTSEGIVDPVDGIVPGRSIDPANPLDDLKATIRNIFTIPPPNVTLPDDLRYLIVYGDDSQNKNMQDLLVELLGADLVRDARVSNSIFDGPSHLAEVLFERMDTVDFEFNVRFPYCQWRSKLYGDHSEL